MKDRLWKRTLRSLHRKYRRAARCWCQEHTDQADWLMERIRLIEREHPEVTR